MKRFYSKAETAPQPGGVAIRLDGRPVKTPARAALLLPTEELAEAIVAESVAWISAGLVVAWFLPRSRHAEALEAAPVQDPPHVGEDPVDHSNVRNL